MEKVLFTDPETMETVEFVVEEETQLNGIKYLLVSEASDDEDDVTFNAYILKEIQDDNGEVTYEVVEDEDKNPVVVYIENDYEYAVAAQYFSKLLHKDK